MYLFTYAFMCKFKKVQLPKLCILKYDLRRTTDKKCRVHVGLIHLLLTITCLQIHQKKNQALIPVFSSPGPKVQVNYCHHLASVVCRLSSVVCRLQSRLSSVNFSHFKLLLRNHWADWNQT